MSKSNKLKVSREPYHYTECGLPNVWLVGVFFDEDGDVVFPNLLQLNNEIAKGIALQNRRLSSQEIRFLRTHIGYSGVDFANAIGKQPETVSRWETSKLNMDIAAEKLLRMMILKELKFNDYDVAEIASKQTKRKEQIKLKYSSRTKSWNQAA